MANIGEIQSRWDLAGILVARLNATVWGLFGLMALKGNLDVDYELPVPGRILSFKLFYDAIAEAGGQTSLEQVEKNALISLHCNMLRDMFRLLESYCFETNQQELLRSQTWYWFARIVSNSLSHNYRYEFRSREIKENLPVRYRDVIISLEDENRPVGFNTNYLYLLAEDIMNFVRKSDTMK